MDSDSRKLIKQIHQEMDGKQPMEMMHVLMKHSSRIKNGKPMSNDERDAMLSALRMSLPDDDRAKLDSLISMLGMLGRK